ncbi:HD family phosphohydrolase [Clostridium oryzae]|uniref:Ribonuclease Y n=1 Tax=Clostridium oryzae TaxID=1450648 RepID=A0A1V4IHI7_9CLOT|nr:HDIG domain-containing metalloprotein [Clostridium oryzae]OPJ59462.1 ribonuclease Y [Clostridium oryzae]
MKKKKNKTSIRLGKVKKALIFLITFIIMYVTIMTSTSVISRKYSLRVGSIAKFDIKAPREIIDEDSTNDLKKQAEDNVASQYSKLNDVKSTSIDNVTVLFKQVQELRDSDYNLKTKREKLKSETDIDISNEDYEALLKLNKNSADNLKETIINVIGEIYDGSRIENTVDSLKKAQESVVTKFNVSNLSSKLRELGVNICYTQIKPNFVMDEKKTEELKEEASKDVEPVVIKKDQIIVKNGEPVTSEQIKILQKLGLLNNKSNFQWNLYLSLAAIVLLILALQWQYIYKTQKDVFYDYRKLILINLLNCLSVILARAFGVASPYIIPFACIPMLLTILINSKVSLIVTMLNIVLISSATQFNVEITILALLNGILGALIIKKMQTRNDIIFSTVLIMIVVSISTFSVGMLLSNNVIEILKRTGLTCVGTVMSGVFTVGLLPIFESTFGMVTVLKLLELANPNQPLLKKLLLEAPGTYHHSIIVGNLAELAADQIGANAALARVASYYHDIGKIRRPIFFKENQMGGENPHNKITPNLSALIITSHVKDGFELGKSENLPQSILDIIEQHHGTSLVKYFYITMKNSSENPDEILEEDFRYPGPIPATKEAAIVMLADSVEAAVRSINAPSKEKIENMVDNIFKDKVNDNQLIDCDLNFREIDIIKRTFLKALDGMYHQRIEYPTEKKEETDEMKEEKETQNAISK